MNRSNKKQGFTLIELMLAMGFVSALLLAIAMTVIQIGNIYNQGITYKSVNQLGGSLASELQRTINTSPPFDIPSNDHYAPQEWGGRLCVGQYSYIWNYGQALQDKTRTKDNLNMYSNSTAQISFVKALDADGSYCTDSKSQIDSTNAVELLDVGQSNTYLAIHSFTITLVPNDPVIGINQRLYNISFVVGTNDQSVLNVADGSTKCNLPDEANSDPTYCAVNQFDIVARAGN